ncbi:DUF1802 family protein [Cohnella caldifontis]|uniref:DUF1802 family protein n=1 Tax=Cohnella caldifontis TaxID=3027471 RepID=UPI0023EBA9BA|nr:DUF1802 family protein [Cohnella sp. YIM B05605]
MTDNENPIALREWAVAVRALEQGRQAVVLRKGGIAEETREFRLESPRFYLFPSYEHQKPHLIKPEAARDLEAVRQEAESLPGRVRITCFAEAAEDIEITDAETLRRLNDLHIWTEDYAEERLKWKKTKPLHVLVLRVYRLAEPAEVPLREAYAGCKSWLRVEEGLPPPLPVPVLDDRRFAELTDAVFRAVRGSPAD